LKLIDKKMKIKLPAILLMACFVVSCSKKHHPQTETVVTDEAATSKPVAKKAARKVIKTGVPKVITVDDRGAQKSVDGRLYYDLEGHRYWKNYNDGRYYIFKPGMFDDPAFKPH
jgi:hypothetical protein